MDGERILIASSKNVEIVGNVSKGTTTRPCSPIGWTEVGCRWAPRETNLNVHDNTFTMNAGRIVTWGLELIARGRLTTDSHATPMSCPIPPRGRPTWGSSGFLTWTEWRSSAFDVDGEVSVG